MYVCEMEIHCKVDYRDIVKCICCWVRCRLDGFREKRNIQLID